MIPLSVIITAHNNAAVLSKTLGSVDTALDYWGRNAPSNMNRPEIIAVDDGSTDATTAVLQEWKVHERQRIVIRRDRPSSPSTARNLGAATAQGELLFFLDGDDRFLESHLFECWQLLQDPALHFVKTDVLLADPVHPDWRPRITHSIVINLCVRKACHEAVGGFPDFHLFRRRGDDFTSDSDIFYKYEDMFYNELIVSTFKGCKLNRETVEYIRYAGNAYDRQYAKFCRPFGEVPESLSDEDRFRLELAQVVYRRLLRHAQVHGVS